ncbi:GntR family transcriptional regulator [Thermopolyspora sp. NPDC052614]|uniref:GntR family transcriptional regulator n=1 Tax=Thermopolyspora sp. NPDC052614 TaxID=3155682 RepID=UPI00342403DB
MDRVAAEVRRAVLSGELPPGRTFSIAELGARLGVSHIPVREALSRLEAQGLIVLRQGRGAMVSPLDRDELRSIFRLRQMLEPDLAARSVAMLTDADLARADELLREFTEGDMDADHLWQVHHELHMVYLRPAATVWDLRILAQLWNASDRYTRVVFDTYAVSDENREKRRMAHKVIFAAARSGSPLEIRQAISEHLADNEAACLSGIAALTTPPPGP